MATKTKTTRRPSKPAPKMDDVMTTAPVSTVTLTVKAASTVSRDAVRRRAFELFLARGGVHGHHVEDWLRAERELASS